MRHSVTKSLGNQARGVQPACTMTTQNSKIRLISSIVKVDNLVINLLLANLIGQFKLVIVQVLLYFHECVTFILSYMGP